MVQAVERPDKLTETEKKMKELINKIKADQVCAFLEEDDKVLTSCSGRKP